MFKRLSSTISTRKRTKTVVNEAPAKAEEAVLEQQQPVEENEPVSESRGEDAPRDDEARDLQREALQVMDKTFTEAEKAACGNDTVRGAMEYALGQGQQEGDAIDQVFNKVEKMTCARDTDDLILAPLTTKKCEITKFSQDEKIGLSLRTSVTTDGLYVSKIASGSKFEATTLELGQKVLKINGVDCPTQLSEGIGMLKGAESALVLEVGPNDEAAKKIDEMGEMSNDLVVKKEQLTEIAVDGYADSCGFFWSVQNGLCAFNDTGVKAIEAEELVDVNDTGVKAMIEAEELVDEAPKKEEAPKDEEEAPKPEEDKLKESPKSKKRMNFKKPSLPSIKAPTLKAPSMPSFKLSKKSKKVEKEPETETETIHGEDGMMTIKFTKGSKDESVGLALRNSILDDNLYVYGIFEGSKLKESGLGENMRVHSINGTEYTNVKEAVTFIKEASSLEFVAGPNDEPEIDETEVEQEQEEEPDKEEASKSWFW